MTVIINQWLLPPLCVKRERQGGALKWLVELSFLWLRPDKTFDQTRTIKKQRKKKKQEDPARVVVSLSCDSVTFSLGDNNKLCALMCCQGCQHTPQCYRKVSIKHNWDCAIWELLKRENFRFSLFTLRFKANKQLLNNIRILRSLNREFKYISKYILAFYFLPLFSCLIGTLNKSCVFIEIAQIVN